MDGCHDGGSFRYLSEALNFGAVRDLVADACPLILVQLKVGSGHLLVEVLLSVGVHQQLIKVICDAATILDLTDHVAHSLPGWPSSFLGVHFQQMILETSNATLHYPAAAAFPVCICNDLVCVECT